ncbi:serine/arginine repetitive matrix protein 1-like [Portunus trituberculatus]|uniref:serine/arginine repetitive matrix protein 1-like n=1 Tax=Portunus trituberculatus TaxID=210409 RepID=UPI001E1D03F0|nr:serine/arginine repetitive matrix protein 1-like [Portunus trituberculatus]
MQDGTPKRVVVIQVLFVVVHAKHRRKSHNCHEVTGDGNQCTAVRKTSGCSATPVRRRRCHRPARRSSPRRSTGRRPTSRRTQPPALLPVTRRRAAPQPPPSAGCHTAPRREAPPGSGLAMSSHVPAVHHSFGRRNVTLSPHTGRLSSCHGVPASRSLSHHAQPSPHLTWLLLQRRQPPLQ